MQDKYSWWAIPDAGIVRHKHINSQLQSFHYLFLRSPPFAPDIRRRFVTLRVITLKDTQIAPHISLTWQLLYSPAFYCNTSPSRNEDTILYAKFSSEFPALDSCLQVNINSRCLLTFWVPELHLNFWLRQKRSMSKYELRKLHKQFRCLYASGCCGPWF